MTDDQREELAIYLNSRPLSVQALARDWPPGAVVRTKPDVILLIPAPGIDGHVASYFEDGTLGVVAPMSIPHPEHGFGELEPGDMVKANVRPDQLDLVDEPVVSRADVAAILDRLNAPEID